MKVLADKLKEPMTRNITIRLQDKSMKMVAALAMEYKVSRMLIINRIVEKSLRDKNFSIEL